jgi:hypothetical protein
MSAKRVPTGSIVLALLACLLLAGTASAGVGIQASMGDTIPLSGYSPTSINVYLFVTGPNLPVNGVALNDITKRADQGGFTIVQVQGDDRWTYNWHTSSINGRLDDGTYTVWAVNGPNDRSNLQNAEYGTISVTLGRPTLSAGMSTGVSAGTTSGTATQSCSLVVTSDPADSSVVVNGEYKGKTPLTVDKLYPGTYAVNVTKFGYKPYSTTLKLNEWEQGKIEATLPADRGSLAVNTTPPGAQVSVDGTVAGITPVTMTGVLPGNHTLTVTKEGYIPAELQVVVAAGATQPVTIVLSPVSPIPTFPLKAPGLTAATLIGIAAAGVAVFGFRKK